MSLRLSTTVRNNACNAIVDTIDQGSAAGTLKIYTGAQPASVADNPSGTLLGTCTFSDPAFGNASTGVATASAITSDTNADNSGTAGHGCIFDSDNNPLMDMTCGLGSGDINFDNNVIVAGGVIAISSMTITQPIS
jgi:hypothetical protein